MKHMSLRYTVYYRINREQMHFADAAITFEVI